MPTVTLQPDPYVEWKFICKNAQQKREKEEIAKSLLKYYLKGYANALRAANPLLPKFSYKISHEKFLPAANGGNVFIFSATLKRKSDPGVPFPGPDSTINPTKPPKPGP